MIGDTERTLDARITRVYNGPVAMESLIFYDAVPVDTGEALPLVHVSPFRRWVFADGVEPPTIKAALVGDHCRIAICQGEARLTDVPEQYLVGPCPET